MGSMTQNVDKKHHFLFLIIGTWYLICSFICQVIPTWRQRRDLFDIRV